MRTTCLIVAVLTRLSIIYSASICIPSLIKVHLGFTVSSAVYWMSPAYFSLNNYDAPDLIVALIKTTVDEEELCHVSQTQTKTLQWCYCRNFVKTWRKSIGIERTSYTIEGVSWKQKWFTWRDKKKINNISLVNQQFILKVKIHRKFCFCNKTFKKFKSSKDLACKQPPHLGESRKISMWKETLLLSHMVPRGSLRSL